MTVARSFFDQAQPHKQRNSSTNTQVLRPGLSRARHDPSTSDGRPFTLVRVRAPCFSCITSTILSAYHRLRSISSSFPTPSSSCRFLLALARTGASTAFKILTVCPATSLETPLESVPKPSATTTPTHLLSEWHIYTISFRSDPRRSNMFLHQNPPGGRLRLGLER